MGLQGIRVLDLTRLLPGPFCSMLLADMGADVVKVEEPGRGDYMRSYPPLRDGQSVVFNAINRNKRSIAINLKSEPGRAVFLKLASRADVVIEGNRPGVMERLGLGWDVLRDHNPKLVLCSITGFGQTGPWAQRAGHDLNYMAIAGALALNAEPGRGPHPLGVQVADIGAGAQGAATAILGALLEVARGEEGRHLDVSMTDGALSWLAVPIAQMQAEASGAPGPGSLRLTGRYACYRVYRTGDGRYYSVGALEPKFWQELCEAMGRPDMASRQYDEGEAQEELQREVERIFASRTRDEWQALLGDRDVCCEPVLDLDEVARHPHVRSRGLVVETPTGTELAPAVPGAEPWRRLPPPGLGEHTEEILGELGIEGEELEALRAEGAI